MDALRIGPDIPWITLLAARARSSRALGILIASSSYGAYITVPAFGRGRDAVVRRADQARRTSANPAVGTFDAVLAIVRNTFAAAALSGSILTERVIGAGGPPGLLFVRSAGGVIVKVGAAIAWDNGRVSTEIPYVALVRRRAA